MQPLVKEHNSRALMCDGLIRGFGSLLAIGTRRRVHFKRREMPSISVEKAWQEAGDSLRSAWYDVSLK